MSLEKKIDINKIMSFIEGTVDMYENIEPVFDQLDPEQIVEFLEKAWLLGEKAWMIQADLLRFINDKSKYGAKAVESVAKEIGICRSYAFELYNISKNLLSRDDELRRLQNLNIGHYIAIVRSLKKIRDPFELLKKASDEKWSTVDLKKVIQGEKLEKKFNLAYYKLTPEELQDKEWIDYQRISGRAYICRDNTGNQYLELKIYEE